MTGIDEWEIQQEDYDYHQEVARSSFADMLHDTERNKKYEAALKTAIETMHNRGLKANVLDIGTGTGLLSMMAVRHGADSVTACEGFKPMSECALKVIRRNGFHDKITIIPKRSTDLTVGPNCDLPSRCNILVTEVFDTELIGEGALETFNQAHRVLLQENSIIVPESATVYAQIVECPLAWTWNKLKGIYNDEGELLIHVPQSVNKCPGSASVHDLQMNQLGIEDLKVLTRPLPVFHFDWSCKTPIKFDDCAFNHVKSERTGLAQAVFLWWNLQMSPDIVLSCAPFWSHPLAIEKDMLPWRDHWMQAIYYLPQEVTVNKGEELQLISCHDEYSLWFGINSDASGSERSKPVCTCGVHVAFSRTRIGQMNDTNRNKKYLRILQEHVNANSIILVLSDSFYLSLAASKIGAKKIYCIESNFLSQKILLDFVQSNQITNVEIFENVEEFQKATVVERVNMVVAEPYYVNSILPWDNLTFMYQLEKLKNVLSSDVKIFPKRAVIKGIAVSFYHLHKIRLPLKKCEGFLMKDFDDLIEASSRISDNEVEAQPLWEYPGIALSHTVDIATIELKSIPKTSTEAMGTFTIQKEYGMCNGIALWVDWVHEEGTKYVISTGPVDTPQVGQHISWDVHTRQGVCLFPNKQADEIKYVFQFDILNGNVSFKFL